MRPERTFTPIDFAAWPRRETFYYFSKMAPTGYSLTVDLDATALHQTLKAANCRLFPAYLWLVTRNLQRQEEFCLAEQDGVLGHYNCLTPLYAAFHEDERPSPSSGRPMTTSFPPFRRRTSRTRPATAHITVSWARPERPRPPTPTPSPAYPG